MADKKEEVFDEVEVLPKELLVSVYETLLEDEDTKLALKVRQGEHNLKKLVEIKTYLEKNYPED